MVKIKENNTTGYDRFLLSLRNGEIKNWFYVFKHGHPYLLKEEADIICETRFDETYMWMNDTQIKELIKKKVKLMYRIKYPKAKRWTIP